MKVCIRRGAKQIGGSAVEVIADDGQRIVLDIGLPLDAENNTPDLLPDIKGLTEKTDDLLGILISHAHQDHYAAGKQVDPAIPVYMGKATKTIMEAARDCHLPSAFCFEKVETFEARKPFTLGAFTVTPYLTDETLFVWSMWNGYKNRYADRFEALNKAGVRCVDLHTSGHADIPALKGFVAKLTPKTVVPIHTFYPERFKDLFDNAVPHDDNEVFDV